MTPCEVFKILNVNEKAFSLKYFGLRTEVLIETPDHQRGYLIGTSAKESSGPYYSYKEYTWTLDDNLVSWIENDLHFSAADSWMGMKVFDSTAEVQAAIQKRYKAKTENLVEKDLINLTPYRYQQTQPTEPQGPSEAEINDLFYKN